MNRCDLVIPTCTSLRDNYQVHYTHVLMLLLLCSNPSPPTPHLSFHECEVKTLVRGSGLTVLYYHIILSLMLISILMFVYILNAIMGPVLTKYLLLSQKMK